MLDFLNKNKWRALFMLVLCTAIFLALQHLLTPKKSLAILQPDQFDPTLVDDSMLFVKKYHKIGPFKLINQNGDTITNETYKDKIYVADFFFTTCPTICVPMAANMKLLQDEFKDDDEVMLLSHSVTPEYDTPAVLKNYAQKKGAIDHKWNLVTGEKEHIYNLARKSYLAVKDAPYGGKYDMVHTENFLLVDKQGRLRSRSYDGTKTSEIEALIEDIYILKEIYKR